MSSVFSEQILADKLSVLNSTQQCIESILPEWLRSDFSELMVDFSIFYYGDPRRGSLANELQDEEASLKECVEKLKLIESNRAVLMFHLKEALQEQV
ncbi:hypothetical protein BHE74_00035372 [Ensete ventricosum]|uniref:Uncharacterized protein n=1 Tax=Ensete ventricosum TaxID=4639 RepID=A0A444F491_ENSVE|nr:hypothetical protein B296_00032090 [Ensete ventricosum]RWW17440.1 hypothetical protein GW17_00018631 [Ensete ventricosum]RWW57809.1 hypothetical protein BHE74_00035372 [Ensete ventricosum]